MGALRLRSEHRYEVCLFYTAYILYLLVNVVEQQFLIKVI